MINLFNLIILLPLAWVLIMSVKSLPDAMRGNFWPKRFDFTHYSFVFQHIATLPVNLFNSIYVTAGDGAASRRPAPCSRVMRWCISGRAAPGSL